MTRSEQIEEAAMHETTKIYGKSDIEWFIMGANWSDKNPSGEIIKITHEEVESLKKLHNILSDRDPDAFDWDKDNE